MSTRTKPLYCILSVLFVLALAAGCQANPPSSPTTLPQSAAPGGGPTTLTLWHTRTGAEQDALVAVEIRRLADSVVESTTEIEGKIKVLISPSGALLGCQIAGHHVIQQDYAPFCRGECALRDDEDVAILKRQTRYRHAFFQSLHQVVADFYEIRFYAQDLQETHL